MLAARPGRGASFSTPSTTSRNVAAHSGETPSGVLTLQLYGQNDADAAAPVAGRWSRAGQEGSLRGRATR